MQSTGHLRSFLDDYYINDPRMGSPHISAAIRDLLSDVMHLCDKEGIEFENRVEVAKEVYNEEKEVDTGDVIAYYNLSSEDWDSTPKPVQEILIQKYKELEITS